MSSDHGKIIKTHYLPRLKKYSRNHEVLDWESREAQIARFEALLSLIDLNGLSLLDVGCGMGDLYGLLKKRKMKTRYTGVDLLPEMIDRARESHKGGEFLVGDAFDGNLFAPKSFDVVYCAGVFNLVMGDNWEFFLKGLEIFLRTACKAVVISLLDDASSSPEDRYFYFNRNKVLAALCQKSLKITLAESYLNNDFTFLAEVPGREP
jgi:ubiquinone/menaquinone biosynthesis C-methylase UbiE